jgi:hypothetical protein
MEEGQGGGEAQGVVDQKNLDYDFSRSQCVEDWLEIYQIYRDNSEELVGRYCASSSPGPVRAQEALLHP